MLENVKEKVGSDLDEVVVDFIFGFIHFSNLNYQTKLTRQHFGAYLYLLSSMKTASLAMPMANIEATI